MHSCRKVTIGGLLSATCGSGTSVVASLYYTFDGNGNVADVTGVSGALAAHYEYDPFGNTLVATGSQAKDNPYRFSTKFADDETGLVYYGYRFYSPGTGRWVGRDPIGEMGGENLYAFVLNAPSDEWDLLGLITAAEGDEFVVIVSGDYKKVYKTEKDIDVDHTQKFEDGGGRTALNWLATKIRRDLSSVEPAHVESRTLPDGGTADVPVEARRIYCYGQIQVPMSISIDKRHKAGLASDVFSLGHTRHVPKKGKKQKSIIGAYDKSGKLSGFTPYEVIEAHERGHARAWFEKFLPVLRAMLAGYRKQTVTEAQALEIVSIVKGYELQWNDSEVSYQFADDATVTMMKSLGLVLSTTSGIKGVDDVYSRPPSTSGGSPSGGVY